MKAERRILLAFVLNLSFAVFEFAGGVLTGSMAICSDAIHDVGDALSIGVAYWLERKSGQEADDRYTYGYGRYSELGGVFTALLLLFGSAVVICNGVKRLVQPVPINYDGMILFAVVGVCVNFCAAWFTRDGESLNQKAVSLHMLEDVLGWAAVLLGAVVMRGTGLVILDPLLSIGVVLVILAGAMKQIRQAARLFLLQVPDGVELPALKARVAEVEGVIEVYHIHVWSMDGHKHCATMHIITDQALQTVRERVCGVLLEFGIGHVTLELEGEGGDGGRYVCPLTVRTECRHGHCHH